jgi:hypothetical protein
VVAAKLETSMLRSTSERAEGPLRDMLPSRAWPRLSASLPPKASAVELLPWAVAWLRPAVDESVARWHTDWRADLGRW